MAGWDLAATPIDRPPSDTRITLQSTKERETRYHGVFGLRPTAAGPWPNIDNLKQPQVAMAALRLNTADLEVLRQAKRSLLFHRHGSYRRDGLHDNDHNPAPYDSYDLTSGIDRLSTLSLELPSTFGLFGHSLPREIRDVRQTDLDRTDGPMDGYCPSGRAYSGPFHPTVDDLTTSTPREGERIGAGQTERGSSHPFHASSQPRNRVSWPAGSPPSPPAHCPTRLPQRVFGPVITNISPNIIKALSMQGAALVVIHNDPTDLPPDGGDK